MDQATQTSRQGLSADRFFQFIRSEFDKIADHRSQPVQFSLADTLMAALAMFSLKDPSLLAFDKRREDPNDNFRSIFGITNTPCDTQMRSILDSINPNVIRPLFKGIFQILQRAKILEQFQYLDGCYLLSLDGTEYFSSKKVFCSHCLDKKHQNGSVTYSHQFLGASLVHPKHKVVIPLAPEPIINEDGSSKNDCERNATKRFLAKFRQDHPRLKVIVVEDGLSANAPHIKDLEAADAQFIIGVKPGDHAYLFGLMKANDETNKTETHTFVDPETGIRHEFRFHNNLPLNESNQDCLVNVLEYWEIHPDKTVKGQLKEGEKKHFSWITRFVLTKTSVYPIMLGGRCRWKIENETFNTLKNQGYNLEHNYGHGDENLSVVLMLLMLLAFLVDQVQQLCCTTFGAAWTKSGTKRLLWERLREYFNAFLFESMTELLQAVAKGITRQRPRLKDST